MRLFGLLVLACLGHGYFWVDIVNRLHAWPGPRKLVDRLTLVCFLLFLVLPILVIFNWQAWNAPVPSSHEVRQSLLRPYVLFCAGWGGVKLILGIVNWYRTDDPRALLEWQQQPVELQPGLNVGLHQGSFAQFLAKVPGNQSLQLKVDRKRLAIPRLHPRHAGMKIAHISDLHMAGQLGHEWYETVAKQVNQLQADLIVVTGDIVEHEKCWPWLANSLGNLRAEHGVYFVLGNHDYYIDVDHTRTLLQEQGLVCLSERWLEIDYTGAPIVLAGNERPWNPQAADLSAAPAKNLQQLPLRIVLLHTPDQFGWACLQDADLALAGHTHGGQLRFPILGPIVCPSRYGTRYACGVFRRGNTVMHVTRGIGGKTPLRWRCPPEIALLELEQA